MPMTIIHSSRAEDARILKKGPTFTGDVYQDVMHFKPEEKILISTVTFTPCARTHWHQHENGQVLEVKVGAGWVCDKGEQPRKIQVGDVVWCPPGTIHWHGADEGSILTHLAVSLGKTTWFEAVTDEEYALRLKSEGS